MRYRASHLPSAKNAVFLTNHLAGTSLGILLCSRSKTVFQEGAGVWPLVLCSVCPSVCPSGVCHVCVLCWN